MERLKFFPGRYLQASKMRYIIDCEVFIEAERILKDLKSDIIDLSELIDKKQWKKTY